MQRARQVQRHLRVLDHVEAKDPTCAEPIQKLAHRSFAAFHHHIAGQKALREGEVVGLNDRLRPFLVQQADRDIGRDAGLSWHLLQARHRRAQSQISVATMLRMRAVTSRSMSSSIGANHFGS